MNLVLGTFVSLSLVVVSLAAGSAFGQNNSNSASVTTGGSVQKAKPQTVNARRSRASMNADEVSGANTVPAPTTSSRAWIDRPSDNISWLKARTSVGAFVTTASELSIGSATARPNQGNQVLRGSGTFNSESTLGVAAQLIEMRSQNWGWFTNASLERSREISSVNLNLGSQRAQGSLTNKPRFLPLILSGGAVYKFNSQLYATGGVNYTLFNDFGGGELQNASMTPKIGYQYGVGFKPFPRMALELMHRDVRYDMDGTAGNRKFTFDDVRLIGFNIVGRYDLE